MKGVHRTPAGTKSARQMNNIGRSYSELSIPADIREHNRKVDEAKAAKAERKFALRLEKK